jgi:hypothetical protein
VKFLVLAYGAEKDWIALSKQEQAELLAQDAVLRERGDTVAAVQLVVTTVSTRDGTTTATDKSFATSRAPLAGFGIIEAEDLERAIQLVAHTPCAVANGAVEIRAIVSSI